MSFSFLPLDQLRRQQASPLLLAPLLALGLHGGVLAVLALAPDPAPAPGQRKSRRVDTPQLLRLSRQLQPAAATDLPVVLPAAVEALPLPPPPPPADADAQAAPVQTPPPESLPVASAAEVMAAAIAWLPAPLEGFDPAAPLQQGIRRRQRWLTVDQAEQLNRLWERSSGPAQAAEPAVAHSAWRSVDREALRVLDLPGHPHGVSLVHGQQLTLIWHERGRWWLIRPRQKG